MNHLEMLRLTDDDQQKKPEWGIINTGESGDLRLDIFPTHAANLRSHYQSKIA